MTAMRVGIDLFSGVSWRAMRGEGDDREVWLVSGVGSSKGKLGGKREKRRGGGDRGRHGADGFLFQKPVGASVLEGRAGILVGGDRGWDGAVW